MTFLADPLTGQRVYLTPWEVLEPGLRMYKDRGRIHGEWYEIIGGMLCDCCLTAYTFEEAMDAAPGITCACDYWWPLSMQWAT